MRSRPGTWSMAACRTSLKDGGFPNLGALLIFFFWCATGHIELYSDFDSFYLHIPGDGKETLWYPAHNWKRSDPRSLQIPVCGEPQGPWWTNNVASTVRWSQLLACMCNDIPFLCDRFIFNNNIISLAHLRGQTRLGKCKIMHSDLQRPWHVLKSKDA